MKGKMELLTNLKWLKKMSIPTVEMLQKEMQSLCNFSFLKIVKIEATNKVQSYFQKEQHARNSKGQNLASGDFRG
jgi:hypothetical protein